MLFSFILFYFRRFDLRMSSYVGVVRILKIRSAILAQNYISVRNCHIVRAVLFSKGNITNWLLKTMRLVY